jgi:hypothetical protein
MQSHSSYKVVGNRERTPKQIVEIVIAKYGFAEEKETKAAAKEAAVEGICECPKNAPILIVFQELMTLYFQGMWNQSWWKITQEFSPLVIHANTHSRSLGRFLSFLL